MNQCVAKYCRIISHIFRNFYANQRTIIDGSISSLPSVRPKTMAIRFSDKFYPLPSRVVALWRVLRLSDRCAVKIYRGKLKCHGIIARSEAIEIPDSEPQTIEPRDRAPAPIIACRCVPLHPSLPPPPSQIGGLTKLQPTLSDYDIPPNFFSPRPSR